MKLCRACDEMKPYEAFSVDNRTRDKLNVYCRECRKAQHYRWREKNPAAWEATKRKHYEAHRGKYRAQNVKSRYGLTMEELAAFGDACMICRKIPTENLHVDHDHLTGQVRGVLCQACNHGLGKFQDNKAYLQEAINYLTRSEPWPIEKETFPIPSGSPTVARS